MKMMILNQKMCKLKLKASQEWLSELENKRNIQESISLKKKLLKSLLDQLRLLKMIMFK
jgi:hypothetical protein